MLRRLYEVNDGQSSIKSANIVKVVVDITNLLQSMSFSQSFEPVFQPDARVLILGSMPGVASLDKQEYYAHPRNLFWSFLAEIFSEPLPQSYANKLDLLRRNRLALWDVLASCDRPGSLDSSIVVSSEQPNDFPSLLKQLPALRGIVFNGKKAEASFRKHVRLDASECGTRLQTICLPSTSPANAAQAKEMKLFEWRQVMESLLGK